MSEGVVARQDQEIAQSKHEATLAAMYYRTLIEGQVPPDAARDLTIAWWTSETS